MTSRTQMKLKNLIYIFLSLIFSAGTSFAQGDKKAQDILKGVSNKLKSYKAIKAHFTYSLENPAAKINESQSGTFHLKGKKFRVDLKQQEIICDSKTIWTYLKDSKEVNISNLDPKEASMNPADIFSMYEKGFKYIFVEEKNIAGVLCQIIDLTPIDAEKSYFKVRLTIDKKRKQLVESKVFDKNGNKYTYSIKSLTAMNNLEDAFFVFNKSKYPGVEIIDLR